MGNSLLFCAESLEGSPIGIARFHRAWQQELFWGIVILVGRVLVGDRPITRGHGACSEAWRRVVVGSMVMGNDSLSSVVTAIII